MGYKSFGELLASSSLVTLATGGDDRGFKIKLERIKCRAIERYDVSIKISKAHINLSLSLILV